MRNPLIALLRFLTHRFRHLCEDIAYACYLKTEPHNQYSLDQDQLTRDFARYIANADEYFAQLTDSAYHVNKPFENPIETPELLWRFTLALSDLRIGPGHTVLDFGCGTCWTSDLLKRMDLIVYALDVSLNALNIGKRVVTFDQRTQNRGDIQFIRFDGKVIPLGDNSIDRVLCIDCFHHVPNYGDVLKDFFRVLRPGGIVGMSEPGWGHSLNPQSKKEMEIHGVLENDVILEDLWRIAAEVGFTQGWIKPALPLGYSIPIDEFHLAKYGFFKKNLHTMVGAQFKSMTVFYLQKGEYTSDSRHPSILSAEIMPSIEKLELAEPAMMIEATIAVKNSGDTKWLSATYHEKGQVKLGIHLYNMDYQLLDFDFDRINLANDVNPGETISLSFHRCYQLPRGEYYLIMDMVAERIRWFNSEIAELPKIHLMIK